MLKMQAIGHLGRDASLNVVGSQQVINFSVAHSKKYKDKDGKEQEKTVWVDCSWWTERVNVLPYLKKGTQVHIDGVPEADLYKTREGVTMAKLKIMVNSLQLLGSKNDAAPVTQTTDTPAFVGAQNSNELQDLNSADDLPF